MLSNILIVEDESIIALDIKHVLGVMGYNVIGMVSSGEEALTIINDSLVDLIIMDVNLKGVLDGVDTAIIIKNNFNIPIIYITASLNLEKHEKIKQTEPYEYIKKPFDNDQLQTVLNNTLKIK